MLPERMVKVEVPIMEENHLNVKMEKTVNEEIDKTIDTLTEWVEVVKLNNNR